MTKTWIAGNCTGCGKTQMRTTDEPDPLCEGCSAPAKIEKARSWLQKHGRHDESEGPCYGRKYPYPDADKSEFTCRCGLSELVAALNDRLEDHKPG